MTSSIKLTPTWGFAVRVYIGVLRNPDASPEAVESATDDLMRLAETVDKMNAEPETDPSQMEIGI